MVPLKCESGNSCKGFVVSIFLAKAFVANHYDCKAWLFSSRNYYFLPHRPRWPVFVPVLFYRLLFAWILITIIQMKKQQVNA